MRGKVSRITALLTCSSGSLDTAVPRPEGPAPADAQAVDLRLRSEPAMDRGLSLRGAAVRLLLLDANGLY